MNDEIDFSATDAPAAPDPALQGPEQQAGAALRRVREAKGVHLVALASALKVPVSHLEHLEAGEFSALPDLVFAKALAASVCRHVGADPAEVMQWWPAVANPTLARPEPAHPVKPATFDPYPGRSGLGWRLLVLLAVLASAAGLFWLWQSPDPMNEEQALTPLDGGQAPGVVSPMVSADADGSATVVAVSPEPSTAESTSPQGATAAPPPGTAESTVTAASPQTATAAPVQAVVSVATPGSDAAASKATGDDASQAAADTAPARELEVVVNQRSWVQVGNARDGVVLARTLSAGDSRSWPLTGGPWSVVVGNVAGVTVRVNGEVRDLSQDTSKGVARFTLE